MPHKEKGNEKVFAFIKLLTANICFISLVLFNHIASSSYVKIIGIYIEVTSSDITLNPKSLSL